MKKFFNRVRICLEKIISKEELSTKISIYNKEIKHLTRQKDKNNLVDINKLLLEKITMDEIRKIVVSDILNYIEVSKKDSYIVLDIYLFLNNNNFLDSIKYKREGKNKVTYHLKYHFLN